MAAIGKRGFSTTLIDLGQGPFAGGLENVPQVKPNPTPERHKKRRTRLSAPAVAIQLVMCNTCSVITLLPTVLSDR